MVFLARKCIVSVSTLTPTRQHYSLPFQTLLFSSSAKVSVPTAEFLTTQHHISPETAKKAASAISHLKYPNRADSNKEAGFSLPQIDLMINKYPRILIGNPKILKEKLKIFEEKGFSTPDIIAIISKNPSVLHQSSKIRMGPSIDALKATLGSTDSVGRLLKRLSWFLKMDLSKTMIPNTEFLKNHYKLSSFQVADFMILSPWFFLLRPETVEEGARRLDEMGLKWSFKMYPHVLRVVCSMSKEKLKLKMNFFQGLGLSDHDALRIFQACPHVFGYSEKRISETMEVLLASGRVDPSFPLKLFYYLSYNLEKRIKPRLDVVKVLEDRGLLSQKLSLSTILQLTNINFLQRFVLSHSKALGDDCVINITKKLGL